MAAKSSDWRPGPSVCRCCFAEGCYKDISTEYFWMGKREVYSEMLSDTFDVTIAYSQTGGPNSNSRLICEPCISRLRDATDFKRQVQECEKVFLQHLAQPTSSVEYEVLESDREEVKLERVKVETKMDDDDDFDDRLGFADEDDDDDLDDQPLTKLASKVPKEESEELLKSLLMDDKKKPEKRKSSTKVKASPAKKTKKIESPKPSVSKSAPKPAAEKKKKDIDGWGVNAATRNAALILRNSTAYPFQINGTSLRCCFCTRLFNDPTCFRSHFDTDHVHTDKSYIVLDNVRPRVDITNLSCKLCLKSHIFPSLERFVEHLNHEHEANVTNDNLGLVPVKLDKDSYQCVRCEKVFEEIVALFRHLDEICDKKFELSYDFKWEITITEQPVTISEQTVSSENISNSQESNSSVIKAASRNAAIILKNSTVYPFRVVGSNIRCCFCTQSFDDPEVYRNHCDTDHLNIDRSCIVSNREKQMQIRVDITNMSCKFCTESQIFSSLEDLVEHLNTEHDAGISSSGFGLIPLKLDKDEYKCVICGHNFKSVVSLSRHTGKHFGRHKCDSCGKGYENKDSLRSHIQICTSGIHQCRFCKAKFSTLEDKIQHVRQSSYLCKPYKCKQCKIGFTNSSHQLTHLESVHGRKKKMFKCVQCKLEFPKYLGLYYHFKSSHTEDFKCQFCGKTFAYKNSLSDHINSHLGDKSHQCNTCGKGFTSLKSLRNHVKIHDDSQKLPCPTCGKLFLLSSRLDDHIRKHHPESIEDKSSV